MMGVRGVAEMIPKLFCEVQSLELPFQAKTTVSNLIQRTTTLMNKKLMAGGLTILSFGLLVPSPPVVSSPTAERMMQAIIATCPRACEHGQRTSFSANDDDY
jgi:hypothetical protein